MKKKFIALFCAVLMIGSVELNAQTDDAASAQHLILGQKASGATVMNSRKNTHPDAQWFQKAGLGLSVHFGIATVHGGIDLSWGMYANKSWEDGTITPNDYWALADQWNPVHFNLDKLAKLAKEAGFKYMVFTTKHHDGYTMWPSKYSDFGVEQKLKGRDLVKEFVAACRKHGLKVGLYFSPPDWRFDANYINWDYSKKSILDTNHRRLKELPKKPVGHDTRRKEMVANQVKELLTNYGKIDLMWFDGGHQEITNDEIRRLQPGIVINRRNGELGDYGDSEGVLPTKRFQGWFETNDPCWPSRWWIYSNSDRMDTADDVIEKLVILRAWGGNLLANVGPKADGTLPDEVIRAWKEMGKWMKHSGESIFDVSGGTFPEQCNQPMTLKGDNVMYLHAFPNFHKAIVVKGQTHKPLKAVLLRTGDEVPFTYENQVLEVQIPAHQRSRSVDTVKLIF